MQTGVCIPHRYGWKYGSRCLPLRLRFHNRSIRALTATQPQAQAKCSIQISALRGRMRSTSRSNAKCLEKAFLKLGTSSAGIRNEYQPLDLTAVPFMMTQGGQQFQNAWANMYPQLAANQAITPQPFFETALGGTSSAFCSGYSSCTAAVASKESNLILNNAQVYDLWQTLSPSFTFGRSMASSPNCRTRVVPTISSAPVPICNQMTGIADNASLGYGSYNGVFVSYSTGGWHGLTARSNFTYSRSLGTQGVVQASSEFTEPDIWNLGNSYGPQPFDLKYVYNLAMLYQPGYYKGQHGLMGRILGGWSFAPIFTARSGFPLAVNIGQADGNNDCEQFGQADCSAFSTNSNAILVSSAAISTARGAGNSVQNVGPVSGAVGSNGNPANGGAGLNLFANPTAVYNSFRTPILGLDNGTAASGGAGVLRGMPTWNLDLQLIKDINFNERFGLQLFFTGLNVLNHMQLSDPLLDINNQPDFGVLDDADNGTLQANTPRQLEFRRAFPLLTRLTPEQEKAGARSAFRPFSFSNRQERELKFYYGNCVFRHSQKNLSYVFL